MNKIGAFLVTDINLAEFTPRLAKPFRAEEEVNVKCIAIYGQRTMEFTTSIAKAKDLYIGKEISAYLEKTKDGHKISFYTPDASSPVKKPEP